MARSTIILGVIAAALLAFILLHERDTLSSGELERRKNRVLTSFVKERLTRIEVVRANETIVLERTPDPGQDGELGAWKLIAPMKVAVDQEAVEVLIGELEWLQPRRVIEDIDAEDQKRFGFTKPRIEVRYTLGKQRGTLLVGANEAAGPGLYARGDDPDVAYVVGKDLFEGLDHDAGHFHTKEMHQGVFLFSASAVVTKDASGQTRGELRDGLWRATNTERSILSTPEIDTMIKAFDQLRAKRYVAQAISGPLSYGLDAPSFTLTVERKRSTDPKTATPVTLLVGAACADHAAETYVQVNRGAVMCASDEDLKALTRPLNQLLDRSAFPVDPDGVTEVQLQTAQRTITLTKKEELWSYRVSGKAQASEQPADRDAVMEWMKGLHGLQLVARDAAQADGTQIVTMQVKSSTKDPALTLAVTRAADGSVLVQRGDESTRARFDASAVPLLTPFASRFRALQVVNEVDAQLSRVSVERAGVTETVERSGEQWSLKSPVRADADPMTLSDIALLLARLSAVRFVADAPAAEHGLSGHGATHVTFQLGDNTRSLHLGASTEGGVFAQLEGDPAVFVVPTRVLETVSMGLLAKTVFATPLEEIAAVTISNAAGASFAVTKDGSRFVANGEAGAAATAVVERIARLRAQELVHYGAALPAEGFERPRLTVLVTKGKGASYALSLGAQTGPAESPRVFVRRSDVAATLTISALDFDRLAEALHK